ncbi:MAG: hypothetical protein JW904_10945 [Spirochaetales bacterium]|nr:hypothetical protein [Spirochaetales bacterium]
MKVLSFIVILCCLTLISMFSQEKEYQNVDPLLSNYRTSKSDGYSWRKRTVNYSLSDEKLSKEKLLSTIWKKGLLSVLVFYKDDRFAYGGVQCGKMITGNYKIISNDQVQLEADDLNFQGYDDFETKEKVFNFVTDKKTLTYSHYLVSDNKVFYAFQSTPDDGEVVLHQDHKVIKETKLIISTDNVNIRKQPSISAPKIDLSSYNTSPRIEKGYLITKGTVVKQVGMFDKEVIINNEQGKWLLIEIELNEDDFVTSSYGWVFSPYFQNNN